MKFSKKHFAEFILINLCKVLKGFQDFSTKNSEEHQLWSTQERCKGVMYEQLKMSWAGSRKVHNLTFQRSSRPQVFCKKGVLKNFAKFIRKHLCQSLFFNKIAILMPVTLMKKRLWHICFPVNFAKFLRAPFMIEHLWQLLLFFTHFVPLVCSEATTGGVLLNICSQNFHNIHRKTFVLESLFNKVTGLQDFRTSQALRALIRKSASGYFCLFLYPLKISENQRFF